MSNSVVNALGLALASTLVLIGANGTIALIRHQIPAFVRLPCFVLVIATFTTIAMLLMQAFTFEAYLKMGIILKNGQNCFPFTFKFSNNIKITNVK